MATIEFIQKRISGKEKELEKLNKKLARIRKVEASGWDDDHNPYYYNENDLRHCLRDIESAEIGLKEYQEQLDAEMEKAGSRNVKVILDFLENWKAESLKFYDSVLPSFVEAKKELKRKESEYANWCSDYYSHTRKERDEAYEKNQEMHRGFTSRWGFIYPYVRRKNETYSIDTEKLQKDLDLEANDKYDYIIERTNFICGKITDASNLTVGDKGDLNGFIIGEKGTASVRTIGAGGYAVQRFHFRTLIHKI